jgi:hypothetical protein
MGMGMGWIPENPTKSNTNKKIRYFYLLEKRFEDTFDRKKISKNKKKNVQNRIFLY